MHNLNVKIIFMPPKNGQTLTPTSPKNNGFSLNAVKLQYYVFEELGIHVLVLCFQDVSF